MTTFNEGENSLELKTSHLAKGIYLVKVSNDTQSEVSKLIIER